VIDRAELDRWMAAAADGDRAAIAPLFHALWPIVVGYATRLLDDRALAEDCAQDALVQLFGQLDRYDRERDALTWALTLATWQCRSARRRRTRRGELDDRAGDLTTATAAGALDGPSLVEHRDLVRTALAALDTLGARDLETVAIAVTDADRAALAPATFRKRLERALSRLRTTWRSRHGTL
jgi:RNA polymerase sigma-70 factor (ECF subfamily)